MWIESTYCIANVCVCCVRFPAYSAIASSIPPLTVTE